MKNDIPYYINNKELFIRRKLERKMLMQGYRDCIDIKNNRDILTSDNTMMLTPSTSNREHMAGIKNY